MISAVEHGPLPGHVKVIAVTFLLSCLGDGLAITALMLEFHDRATRGFGIAALFAAMAVPAIVLAGLAGRIADRCPARRVLPPLGLALVAVCALMSLAHSVALLVILFAVLSGLMTIAAPVFVKVVLQASPGPLMSRANALVSMASQLGFLIGPAIGALLMDAIGLRGVLLVDAVTYLAVPLVACFIPSPNASSAADGSARSAEKSGFLAGLRLLMRHTPLARIVLIGAVLTFALQVTNVVEVYLVRDAYGATATVFGLVTTAWAGGNIIGTGIAGRWLSERHTARAAVLTASVVVTALLAVAAMDNLPGLFVLTTLAGAAEGAFGVARQTTLGRVIDPAGQGSAVAAQRALLNTATVLALMSAGLVSSLVQPRIVYALAGGLLLLALVAPSQGRIRPDAGIRCRARRDGAFRHGPTHRLIRRPKAADHGRPDTTASPVA
ncbi:MFS transporter [Streptomyces sp. NPDC002088]|uniref:MFS transporter n=1 Tax=Streptomyces sp. NPDC002088 TaxID=3154665 RepID=UPI003323C791